MCVGNIEDETRWTIEGIKRILALDGADLSRCRESDRLSRRRAQLRALQQGVRRILPGRAGSAAPRWRRAPSSSARSKWTQSRTNRDADEQADAKRVRQGRYNGREMDMLRLLGRNTSGNVQKVIFLLEELGAPYSARITAASSTTPRTRRTSSSIPTARCRPWWMATPSSGSRTPSCAISPAS